jgi:glutaredoxin
MGLFDFLSGGGRIPPNAPSPDQAHELLLYKYDSCPFCRRVFRSIDQLGLDVPMADILRDPGHRAELARVAGRTTVPCLFIDGEPMFESADIVAWLTAYAEGGAKA